MCKFCNANEAGPRTARTSTVPLFKTACFCMKSLGHSQPHLWDKIIHAQHGKQECTHASE